MLFVCVCVCMCTRTCLQFSDEVLQGRKVEFHTIPKVSRERELIAERRNRVCAFDGKHGPIHVPMLSSSLPSP